MDRITKHKLDRLYDWTAAAMYLNVPEKWLRNQHRMKRGPVFVKPSYRTILFREADLDSYRAGWEIVTD